MSGKAADFPLLYPVLMTPLAINGDSPPAARSFPVNTSFEPYRRDAFRHRTIQSQRESISLTDIPGEGTINTEGLWRRGAFSWHHGAGQLYGDRGVVSEADPFRFYESKGVDPWTEFQLGLLPDVTQQVVFTEGDWVQAISVDKYVYILRVTNPLASGEATSLRWTTDYSAYTTPTGLTGMIWWIFTDGYWVYASGDNGLYVQAPGGAAWKHVISQGVGIDFAGCANGRVIMTSGPTIYDVTTKLGTQDGLNPGNLDGAAVWTHPNPNWVWSAICSGQSAIYMSGYMGQSPGSFLSTELSESAVYLLTEEPQTGVLDPPTVALPVEGGEIIGGLEFYLNYVVVGSSRGYRLCNIAGTNNPDSASGCLIPGELIPNNLQPLQPILQPFVGPGQAGVGMVGYDRFVWFGWPSYDSVSCGLGRMDLSVLTSPITPAYASDLMINSTTVSIQRLFWCPITNGPGIVAGATAADGTGGIYTRKVSGGLPVAVASGTLNSGRLTFGIPDPKLLAQANYNVATDGTILPGGTSGVTIGGSVALASNADGAGFVNLTPLAPRFQTNPPVLVSPLTSAEEWQIQVTLSSASSGTQWPFLTRWTVKALPQIVSGTTISPVFELYSTVSDGADGEQERPAVSYDDYLYLESMRLSQRPIKYQEGAQLLDSATDTTVTGYTAIVVITEIDWLPFKRKETPDGGYEGDLILYAKTIVG